jgi:hypothetical protein
LSIFIFLVQFGPRPGVSVVNSSSGRVGAPPIDTASSRPRPLLLPSAAAMFCRVCSSSRVFACWGLAFCPARSLSAVCMSTSTSSTWERSVSNTQSAGGAFVCYSVSGMSSSSPLIDGGGDWLGVRLIAIFVNDASIVCSVGCNLGPSTGGRSIRIRFSSAPCGASLVHMTGVPTSIARDRLPFVKH